MSRISQTDDLSYLYIQSTERVLFLGHEVSPPNSLRCQTFRKSLICVTCGITGCFLGLDRPSKDRPHVNLYAIGEDGKEVLMTKDHIIPVSKGGKNVLKNLQTMCTHCNLKKGNELYYKNQLGEVIK